MELMNALLFSLTLASTLISADEPVDLETVAARYELECAAGAPAEDCDLLRAQLENRLFDDLVSLSHARATVDRETLRIATRAQSPWLAAYALALLDKGFGPGDVPYVRAALDSPYPLVRSAAVELSNWFETDALRAPTRRAREALGDGSSGPSYSALAPDLVPTAEALGAPLYPGADYSYLAGSSHRPVFLTADDPQRVVAFLAQGRPTFTAAEMTAAAEARRAAEQAAHDAAAEESEEVDMAAAMEQAGELMAAMSSGKDPMEAIREMAAAKQAALHDWTAEITRLEGIGAPRFVVVEQKQGVPTRVVAVYRDSAVDATAIAYLEPPSRGHPGMNELATDPDAMTRWQRWQGILSP
jgi:hypothetical protein